MAVDAAALKACPLFKGFTDTGLQIVAGVASSRAFPRGAPLFLENAPAESMLIVADGTVRLSSKSASGEEVTLGDVGAGEPLGELSLVQKGQRMCTATALTDVSAIEIRHADFQKLLAVKPQACLKLLMSVVSHVAQKVRDNREAWKSLVEKA